MTDMRVENFFAFIAFAFISVLLAPYFSSFFSLLAFTNMDEVTSGDDSNGGSFLKSVGSVIVRVFKVVGSVAVGGFVWFAWNLGLTANDIWYGFPIYKQHCRIVWPIDLSGKNYFSDPCFKLMSHGS